MHQLDQLQYLIQMVQYAGSGQAARPSFCSSLQKPQIKRKNRIKRIEMKVELDLQKEHWRLVVQELVKFLVTLLPVVKQKEKVTLQL
jgi:hypothetical protein